MHKKRIVRRGAGEIESLPGELHPILRRVYAARRVSAVTELERTLDKLHPYAALKGINAGTALLVDTLEAGRRIMIVADFDADGATSCAVAVRALRALGAAHVDFVVPNRFEYGYGLTPEIVAVAAQRQPDVLITVDNGISSHAGVAAARERGMRVLVTDHHLAAATLPEADAIVNPNQPGCTFPSKCLAGVGVIFYVMLALRAALRESGWFAGRGIKEANLAQWLDLVALGTVADVVPLDHNNRILVSQGIARIRAGQCGAGIQAILEVAGRKRETVAAADMGFAVGPRLNAAGRLEDMSLGIDCLLTDDLGRAREMAAQLDALNRERRHIENQMQVEAWQGLQERLAAAEGDLPTGLCLYEEGWHQGVIGILASRIKDKLHRPVIAFAADGRDLKGSARSVPGLHIRDALDEIAARHPGLVSKFGGHAMAAGLTLPRENLAAFRAAFDEVARAHLAPEDLQGIIYSDGELGAEHICVELAEQLRNGGPWGQGFPEPMFDGSFDVVERRVVGERHLKMILRTPCAGRVCEAISFNGVEPYHDLAGGRVRVAYKLDVNEYRGQRSAQLLVEHVEPG